MIFQNDFVFKALKYSRVVINLGHLPKFSVSQYSFLISISGVNIFLNSSIGGLARH